LQVSTALARDMVTKYGMSEKLGPIALESPGGKTLFGVGVDDKDYSQKVGAEIDAEVSKIMKDALLKAESIVKKYRKTLDVIASKLIEVETLERGEFENILIASGIPIKKKEDIEHDI